MMRSCWIVPSVVVTDVVVVPAMHTSHPVAWIFTNPTHFPSGHFSLDGMQQICVPDWPFYNRHPVKWLESVPDRRAVNN